MIILRFDESITVFQTMNKHSVNRHSIKSEYFPFFLGTNYQLNRIFLTEDFKFQRNCRQSSHRFQWSSIIFQNRRKKNRKSSLQSDFTSQFINEIFRTENSAESANFRITGLNFEIRNCCSSTIKIFLTMTKIRFNRTVETNGV